MRLIYKHDNVAVLHSVKNVLALHNIDSFVKDEQIGAMGARFGISNTFMELWLEHDQDYEKACAIIENEITNPESKNPWMCTGCDEENDGSFEFCWKCQKPRLDA